MTIEKNRISNTMEWYVARMTIAVYSSNLWWLGAENWCPLIVKRKRERAHSVELRFIYNERIFLVGLFVVIVV